VNECKPLLVGHPTKVFKNTAFINGMFNSALEVAKFEVGPGVYYTIYAVLVGGQMGMAHGAVWSRSLS
jgi:hypothetical protein